MSRQGFRFIHATNMRLDEPLVGTGVLAREDRDLAEQATLLAWDEIVETCLSAQVDFLLLTGNCFDHRSQSLRARAALERGLEKLDAHHLEVFIAPGNLDPHSVWKRWVRLPPNVTLLGDEQQDPVAIVRDGSVLASLFTIATPETDESNWQGAGPVALHASSSGFQIGVLPAGTPLRWKEGRPVALQQPGVSGAAARLVEGALRRGVHYIACGEGVPLTFQTDAGYIHDPGPPQSLSKQVSGSCGCTVVAVEPGGEIRLDDVAVASIRWEDISITIDRHTNWNDLVERMALQVMECIADNDERLWLMNWRVQGEGKLFDALQEPGSEQELWDLLEAELEGETEVHRRHRLERMTRQLLEEETQQAATGLLREIQSILEEQGKQLVEATRRELLESSWLQRPELRSVQQSISQASSRAIRTEAEAIASRWFD